MAIAVLLSLSLSQAKKIVKSLVDEGELAYQDLYGGTYVTQSFLRSVRISPHFLVTPPGIQSKATLADKDILLLPGISFGSGQHPTTRLCLAAIDFLFFDCPEIVSKISVELSTDEKLGGVDIGTGSGVLAIAMCLAGLERCQAFDIDPVSVNEARQNVSANCLDHGIQVIEGYMGPLEKGVSVICANLRYPTLVDLSGLIQSTLFPNGVIILSGARQWEKSELIHHYSAGGFSLVWDRDEKNWSAVVMTRLPE